MRIPAALVRASLVVALVLFCRSGPAASRAAQRSSFAGGPRLADIYDAILDARFTDASKLLEQSCTPRNDPGEAPRSRSRSSERAPAEACQLLGVVSLWWQIQLDPENLAHDATFASRADAAIAAIEAWTEAEPMRAEAWFYLGGAYGARAQWRVLRGERLAAARDGKRIKQSLERALELDDTMQDAYFGIGLYKYYADVAPTAAKMMRWLLALPGGNKTEGMREMLQARQRGELLRDEADYQLHLIYLWYEKEPDHALALLRALAQAHPRNPLFAQQAADVEDVYLHDHAASLTTWRSLFDAARAHRVAEPAMTEIRARIGMAQQLDALYETDTAVEQLRAVIDARPDAPFESFAYAQLLLGRALDRLGQRDEAVAQYRSALMTVPARDPWQVADGARAGLRKAPNADEALAYRLSIEGGRALDKGDLPAASRALTRSLALRPNDQATRYRQARLLEARKEDLAAIELYESVMSAGAATPPTFFADASLRAAHLYELQHDEERAVELYQRALTSAGAEAATKTAATRALTRLRK
jgi:tetratricopeptide (TPR) repeat protein